MKLYEITNELLAIADAIAEADGELTDAAATQLDALEGDLAAKAASICKAIRSYRSEAAVYVAEGEQFKEEIKRLASRAHAADAVADRLEEYIKLQLESLGMKKLAAGTFKLSVCNNSRPRIMPPDDPEAIPQHLRKPPAPPQFSDAAALAEWTEFGTLPDGFRVEVGTHLRIT